ncbi:MAG: hypothetical protein ACI4BB_10265 [Coprococcus sp.]
MIRIEVLFSEFCGIFADSSNIRYLEKCLPDAEFVYTSYTDEPLFVKEAPDLIYMGAMSESAQEKIISKLMPYRDRIKELIEMDVPILLTNNAMEILGQYIENEDGSRVQALALYPFYAKRDMMHRFNCLVRGHYKEFEIVGFKTQFTMAYGDTDAYPFIHVDRGTGMNKGTANEGIHDHNLFATYVIGPLLILNPVFTRYLLRDVMKLENAELAFESVIMDAYQRRLKEFKDPKTEF